MAVGITVTKAEVDNESGSAARDLHLAMRRAADFKAWLDGQGDPDLTALGYSAGDIANLRSAFGDALQIADIWRGAATLGAAKDFRTFLKRLAGLKGT